MEACWLREELDIVKLKLDNAWEERIWETGREKVEQSSEEIENIAQRQFNLPCEREEFG